MTADFFEPDTAYLFADPFKAPEIRPEFRCLAVGIHPSKEVERAFGFYRPGNRSEWVSVALTADDWREGWIVRPQAATDPAA